MKKQTYTVLLAGNPNVGKSTVFNALTGLKQHTGNWAGKTVENAMGSFQLEDSTVTLIDLPGTYSLNPLSEEEKVAVDSICFEEADAIIVVGDATMPLRGIAFAMQIAEARNNLLFCLNLADEAGKQKITVDAAALSEALGMPVVLTAARRNRGMDDLLHQLKAVCDGESACTKVDYGTVEPYIARCEEILANAQSKTVCSLRRLALELLENEPIRTAALAERLSLPPESRTQISEVVQDWQKAYTVSAPLVCAACHGCSACGTGERFPTDGSTYFAERLHFAAERLCAETVKGIGGVNAVTRRLDRIFLGKWTGIPCFCLLLAGLLWISLSGANYPSQWLSRLFAGFEKVVRPLTAPLPNWLDGILWDGGWRVLSWVVAVMLPPMAIFFPLFTLLEDFGLLPRIAFLMDAPFAAAGSCGKQMLTMCMSLGCNCTGAMGARIIDQPQQRKIALLTNNFMPCNGRFPLLLALISLFCTTAGGIWDGAIRGGMLILLLLFSVGLTLLSAKLLHRILFSGQSAGFVMELPPYRPPQVGKVLIRSLFDRTLRVLGRAASAAAPAGMLLWTLSHVSVGDLSLLQHFVRLLEPIGHFFGMDGAILAAFLLGLPANEIVLPILLLCYSGSGVLAPVAGLSGVYELLTANGWTAMTALAVGIFCICHFPCYTALRTIEKESNRSTAFFAALLPTAVGLSLCLLVRLASLCI